MTEQEARIQQRIDFPKPLDKEGLERFFGFVGARSVYDVNADITEHQRWVSDGAAVDSWRVSVRGTIESRSDRRLLTRFDNLLSQDFSGVQALVGDKSVDFYLAEDKIWEDLQALTSQYEF